ncbi:serine hydrolase [candidate division NPL-UPA2 bacterium]|nr:serine hydrolase [candidate division NPL-UPA2 bacterium]
MISKWHKFRTFLVLLVLSACLIYLLQRLYQIQLVMGEALGQKARAQHQRNFQLSPRRGNIYDRNGKKLALTVSVDSICAWPERAKSITDKEIDKLSSILRISPSTLREKLHSRRPFVFLARKVDRGLGAQIRRLNLPGIDYLEEVKRFYPKGSLGAHLLGFVGVDGTGLEGLELYYDRYLRGTPGWRQVEKDARGREILPFRDDYTPPMDGYHLVLTIDKVIQHIAERELERTFQEREAKGGTLVVMDPKTGEILALANRPTFNPNSFKDYPANYRRNRAITDIFEPGSTFKVITAAAALEERLFQLEDKIFCEEGSYRLNGHSIRDVRPHGWLSFKEVIEVSSNIGTVKIGQALGKERLYEYIRSFGFGAKTGIDFPGEVRGLIRTPQRWSKLSLGAIPFGQEIAVTAVQLATALSAIANGGLLMRPRVVDAILDQEGEVVRKFESQVVRRVISSQTAKQLTEILVGVVENGTGRTARLEGYAVAGKTGTAQKAERGGYSDTKFISSFMGYLPAEDPEVVIVVIIDEPQGDFFGATVAGPTFRRVAEGVMSYLKATER